MILNIRLDMNTGLRLGFMTPSRVDVSRYVIVAHKAFLCFFRYVKLNLLNIKNR